MAVLESRKVTKSFGGLVAVGDLDLIVEQGMIASLIGPNGACKTTFFNMANGLYPLPPERSISRVIAFPACAPTALRPWVSAAPSRPFVYSTT